MVLPISESKWGMGAIPVCYINSNLSCYILYEFSYTYDGQIVDDKPPNVSTLDRVK